MIEFEIPIRIQSLANARLHWAAKAKVIKGNRNATIWTLLQTRSIRELKPPLSIRLVRIGPRLMDVDNSISGFKAVRDEIALFFGVDDGSHLLRWRYGQEIGPRGHYSVRVEIVPLRDADLCFDCSHEFAAHPDGKCTASECRCRRFE